MEKVVVTFKWQDGVFDRQYIREREVYRIDKNYVVSTYEDRIEIEPITSIEKGEIIVDIDDEKYKNSIDIQFQHVKDFDIAHSSVNDFLKYLIS